MPNRICAAVILLSLMVVVRSVSGADRPNILFILSDDHGYQAISAYDGRINQTPNIDRLAREGMRFDRAFVTNSICGPARAVMLTGLYSHLNGFALNGDRFDGAQPNVAKFLRASGYETAVIGKWHLETDPTGFDYWEVLQGQGPYYNPVMLTAQGKVPRQGYTTEIITERTLHWLEHRDRDQPFFLLCWHKAPHRNWAPGPNELGHRAGETIPEPATLFDDYEGRGSAARQQEMMVARDLTPHDLKLAAQGGMTEEQRALWDAQYGPENEAFERAGLTGDDLVRWKYQRYAKDYLACVEGVDKSVGQVLEYLDRTGQAENTLVVYSSDQGWFLGEHGWYDKRWMYEESFRTPLLVRWPGHVAAGSVSTDLCLNLDLPETFLEAAGVEIPESMQGRSLVPILEGRKPEDWRDAVYYRYYEFPGPHSVAQHYGVRTDRYKLIYFPELDEWEMYDLESDPDELQRVAENPAYAQIRAGLERRLRELQQEYRDDGTIVRPAASDRRRLPAETVWRVASDEAMVLDADNLPHRDAAAELDPTGRPLVLGGWIEANGAEGVLMAQGGESHGYALGVSAGRLVFSMRLGGRLLRVAGGEVPRMGWSHVAVTLDEQGLVRLWINGRSEGEGAKMGVLLQQPLDGLDVGIDRGSRVDDSLGHATPAKRVRDLRLHFGRMEAADWDRWVAP